MEWELFFFPWHENPDYTLEGENVIVPDRLLEYKEQLEQKYAIRLTNGQLAWYTSKEKSLGADIRREYPATPEEAFEQSIEGAYYHRQINDIYSDGRLTSVPLEPSALVHTFWDLGMSDTMCIWFIQQVGREYRVINYYQNSGEGLAFYKSVLDELREKLRYNYGFHVAPHDIAVRELGTGKSRLETAQSLGIDFITAPKLSIADGIEAVRTVLPLCWFDEVKTEKGFSGLSAYRKDWDDKHGVWKSQPVHDEASHSSDAFRTFAVALNEIRERMNESFHTGFAEVQVQSSGGWA